MRLPLSLPRTEGVPCISAGLLEAAEKHQGSPVGTVESSPGRSPGKILNQLFQTYPGLRPGLFSTVPSGLKWYFSAAALVGLFTGR
jgi:hypothetical protein